MPGLEHQSCRVSAPEVRVGWEDLPLRVVLGEVDQVLAHQDLAVAGVHIGRVRERVLAALRHQHDLVRGARGRAGHRHRDEADPLGSDAVLRDAGVLGGDLQCPVAGQRGLRGRAAGAGERRRDVQDAVALHGHRDQPVVRGRKLAEALAEQDDGPLADLVLGDLVQVRDVSLGHAEQADALRQVLAGHGLGVAGEAAGQLAVGRGQRGRRTELVPAHTQAAPGQLGALLRARRDGTGRLSVPRTRRAGRRPGRGPASAGLPSPGRRR